jgi:hypothetical protein
MVGRTGWWDCARTECFFCTGYDRLQRTRVGIIDTSFFVIWVFLKVCLLAAHDLQGLSVKKNPRITSASEATHHLFKECPASAAAGVSQVNGWQPPPLRLFPVRPFPEERVAAVAERACLSGGSRLPPGE